MQKQSVRTMVRGIGLGAAAVSFLAGHAWAQTQTRPAVGKTVKVGPGVYELVASRSTGTIYVASAGARNAGNAVVTVLNGNSLDVIKTIDVSAAAPYGMGFNDRTQTLYTSNTRNGSVSAIDVKSGNVTNITTEADKNAHLRELAVDEENNVIYASSYSRTGIIWVIDGKTNTVAHVIQNVGDGTAGLAVDAAGKRLFASNMSANEIAVIDTTSRQVVKRYPAGGQRPSNLAFDARANRLYVANQNPGTVSVLDMSNGTVLSTLTAGAGTLDVEISGDGSRVYAANRGAGTVTVFDAKTFAEIATLDTGGAPNTLAVDTQSGLVYVSKKPKPQPRGRQGGTPGAPAPPADDNHGDTVTVLRP